MYRIIGGRGSGKTSRVMLLAKENNATIVCSNPNAMRNKAQSYGITGINFISYNELFDTEPNSSGVVFIDEIEQFLSYALNSKILGYSLTNED